MSSHKRRKTPMCDLGSLFKTVKEALSLDLLSPEMARRVSQAPRGCFMEKIPASTDPYTLKKLRQVAEFDKRIIWPEDTSFEDLSVKCFQDFADSQKTFGIKHPMSKRAQLVLERSREICTQILGYFSIDEWLYHCSFGKRAAVTLPLRESYLDVRFQRVSGSKTQLQWFGESLATDVHLLRAVRSKRYKRRIIAHVRAAAVPKSWKSARIVVPDTVVGGFLSRGLGAYMRIRIERNTHIDLAKQQDRHRRWARKASLTGKYATIDMRKASDSFVEEHIEWIMPLDWQTPVFDVRNSKCDVGGQVIDLKSVMLMGSGHTFPLQTLLFYCLAEATRQLLNVAGHVSVYGDDIMLPTDVAPYFSIVMDDLGFSINSEKSFWESHDPLLPSFTLFRESCGGDYKGGIDVRPYMPECDLQAKRMVPANEYLAWCHKIYNGLVAPLFTRPKHGSIAKEQPAHWDLVELPLTLALLLRSAALLNRGSLFFVPPWETDHAGFKGKANPVLCLGYVVSEPGIKTGPGDLHSEKGGWLLDYSKIVFVEKKRKRSDRERPYQWYAYWQARSRPSPDDIYDVTVPTGGEPLKDVEGVYRRKIRQQN